MKKLALTSLLAVFAATAASAANTYDFNPMYRPDTGHFYSETSLTTDTDSDLYTFGTELGYGVTNELSLFMQTAGSAYYPEFGDDDYTFNNFALGMSYRFVDEANWKADIIGKVKQLYDNDGEFNTYAYDWTVGGKLGYVTNNWTVAGGIEYLYSTDDVPGTNWETETWAMTIDGQYNIDSDWNVTAGLTYTMYDDESVMALLGEDDKVDARMGVNYNIDSSKVIGVYLTQNLTSDIDDETVMGAKFGIDF